MSSNSVKIARGASEAAPAAWTEVEPPRGLAGLKLRELWSYRELLLFLTWKEILVRYKQAVLGVGWAVVQPVLTMVVFTVIFGRLVKVSSQGSPYAIFVFAGLLPWQLFATALQRAGTSLVSSANLLTKVYFPRLVIPLATVLAGLVDFVISFAVLLVLMAIYHVPYSWHILWMIPLTALALLTALAVGLWLAALNVLYRDVQYIIPFIVQVWMFASPVAYSANVVPVGKWRLVYGLNPVAGVIQGFRWAALGGPAPSSLLGAAILVVLVLLVTGSLYFKQMERTFADVV
jgi:lipopolysaccharide transport system permease protein